MQFEFQTCRYSVSCTDVELRSFFTFNFEWSVRNAKCLMTWLESSLLHTIINNTVFFFKKCVLFFSCLLAKAFGSYIIPSHLNCWNIFFLKKINFVKDSQEDLIHSFRFCVLSVNIIILQWTCDLVRQHFWSKSFSLIMLKNEIIFHRCAPWILEVRKKLVGTPISLCQKHHFHTYAHHLNTTNTFVW